MSKPVKDMMIRDYGTALEGVDDALVISIRGIASNDNNRIRMDLAKKNIRITVVRNNLAKHTFKESPLAVLDPILNGPSAIAYGGNSVVDVARELVKWAGQVANLELKGAVLDGMLFEGDAGVKRLSKFPTREEAVAKVVTLFLSPAKKLAAAALGPGGRVVGCVKTIADKLEKGEAISKIA